MPRLPLSLLPSPFSPGSKFSAQLRTYFRSGWAFLIPYLAAYLLYAWLDWPVNAGAEGAGEGQVQVSSGGGEAAEGIGEEIGKGTGERSLNSPSARPGGQALQPFSLSAFIPSLLHVYWVFHAIHFVLGGLALWRAWRTRSAPLVAGVGDPGDCVVVAGVGDPGDSAVIAGAGSAPISATARTGLNEASYSPSTVSPGREATTVHRPPCPLPLAPRGFAASPSAFQPFSPSAFQKSAPWLLLALIFWIPGLYLEWPSDPWEHLRRINEWHAHSVVTAHSAWDKSSYFLPYSLTGHTTGLTQLSWLNFYYTGICLLLCWQYYRLARAVGLGERASMIFVILQALLMGNNVFSFYRYYGLSSSIFAQLGAVALTRIALEAVGAPRRQEVSAKREEQTREADGGQWTVQAGLSAATPFAPSPSPLPLSSPFALRSLLFAAATLALLLLIAANHIQGIGIAGMGVMAVIVWRLIEWKRSMIGWLVLATVLLSLATVLWFPRHPAIDDEYRPLNWLTPWYGFNLFQPSSPAFERMMVIIGAFGLLNLIAGLWLVRRNHVAGWLTLMPILAFALPCIALPFAHVIVSTTSIGNIITYHRMFFAIPMGLAVVVLAARGWELATNEKRLTTRNYPLLATRYSLLYVAGLAGAVILSPGSSAHNRIWHSLQITADDLNLRHLTAAWTPENRALAEEPDTLTISHPLGTKVKEAFLPSPTWYRFRAINIPLAVADHEQQLDWLSVLAPADWKPTKLGAHQNWQAFSRDRHDDSSTGKHVDFTASATPWMRLGGQDAELAFAGGRLTIKNPLGAASHVFSPALTTIERNRRYRLTSKLRQTGDSDGTNYLAVAWYDREGRLLHSHQPQPEGAGTPVGWSNGSFSYYGLANHPAPPEWTDYTIAFGLGEAASIPVNAAFLRAGALLNYQSTAETVVQLKDVILHEKSAYKALLLVTPASHRLLSQSSQAAKLSRHWSTQSVHTDHGANKELYHLVSTMAKP